MRKIKEIYLTKLINVITSSYYLLNKPKLGTQKTGNDVSHRIALGTVETMYITFCRSLHQRYNPPIYLQIVVQPSF